MPQPFSVMTFNIRTSLAKDGRHEWANRRDLVVKTIRDHDPDLLGLQEPTQKQWTDMEGALAPERTPVAHSRKDKYAEESHLQGGFVKASRFEPVRDGQFWLSDTPDVPGSVTFPMDWGARTVDWMRLRDKICGRELLFAVTHFDTNEGSWLPSAKVMGRKLPEVADGLPVIAVGDFNCAAGSPPWKHLTGEAGFRDAWTEAGLADAGVLTYNAFRPDRAVPMNDPAETKRWLDERHGTIRQFAHYTGHILSHGNYRIDWILLRGSFKTSAVEVDYRTEGGLLSSDHYPVIATVEFA